MADDDFNKLLRKHGGPNELAGELGQHDSTAGLHQRAANENAPGERMAPWWAHVVLATMLAGIFAAVPFWMVGLPLWIAETLATIIFPAVIVAYILVMKGIIQ